MFPVVYPKTAMHDVFFFSFFFLILLTEKQQCANFISIEQEDTHTHKQSRSCTPLYIHMEKAEFLYFEVEAPNGINLILFRNSSLTFSAKIRKKIKVPFLVINLLMLQNRGYSALNGLISNLVAHYTCIF